MLPKVLLIEDDEFIREIYLTKFKLENFTVATAENGQIGLEMVKDFQPQIVLLDMTMPVMGGLDFLRSLRSYKKEIPTIIAFSNISAAKQIESAKKLGARAYWIKSDYIPERCVQEVAELWRARAREDAAMS